MAATLFRSFHDLVHEIEQDRARTLLRCLDMFRCDWQIHQNNLNNLNNLNLLYLFICEGVWRRACKAPTGESLDAPPSWICPGPPQSCEWFGVVQYRVWWTWDIHGIFLYEFEPGNIKKSLCLCDLRRMSKWTKRRQPLNHWRPTFWVNLLYQD